jgi:galactose mutarotase-like enzyme
MHTIGNELLSVAISPYGAELQSIRATATDTEFLWQGNPDIWSGRAPILFPIVGALKDGQYEFERQLYKLPRHGLARISEFTLTDAANDSARFQLTDSGTTRQVFPWRFVLEIGYTLTQNRLNIEYRVENPNNETLRFTIGSHPAFQLPGAVENYHIRFSHPEALQRFALTEDGLLEATGTPYPIDNQSIVLTGSLFDDDALVFRDIRSTTLTLCDDSKELISVHTGGAPHLGLWSRPAAPFVCIEPWFGYSDQTDASGNWLHKPALLSVPPGDAFVHQWAIQVGSVGR